MSQPTPAPPAAPPTKVSISKLADMCPKVVTHADCLPQGRVDAIWQTLYRNAGVQSAGEDKKMAFRLWVYTVGCINGTSRAGEYTGVDQLADGTTVKQAIIPNACGFDIRKFYRSNMSESSEFLKQSGAIEKYERHVSKINRLGYTATEAWAASDWMKGNPVFTTRENDLHELLYTSGVTRARRARGGDDLEVLEREKLARHINANGADSAQLGRGERVDF